MTHIMWVDFFTLKIKNGSVVILCLLYIPFCTLVSPSVIIGDLFAAVLLFAIALALWMSRMLGAGDVKLFGALGLFVGFDYLDVFVFGLLFFSVLFLFVLAVAMRMTRHGKFLNRLREIKLSRRAPYGVVMCLSAFPSLLLRLVDIAQS
ncbi:prepilin peptidase CpaA [Marivita geojedonensis]|nr:prepilin peptidase CpaA [Marivita geojedonensis]